MTEILNPLDGVLTWKDVGDGVPAQTLTVPPADQGLPRITPNVVWEGRFETRTLFYNDQLPPRGQLDWIQWANENTDPWAFAFVKDIVSPRTAGERLLIQPTNAVAVAGSGSIGVSFAAIPSVGWAIGPGLPIPPNVIAAEDDLSTGALFPSDYPAVQTIEIALGRRRVRFGLTSQAKSGSFGSSRRQLLYFETNVTRTEEAALFALGDAADTTDFVTLRTVPVFYGQQPQSEGPFTARRLFSRRDDSEVETVDYTVDEQGDTQATVRRVTDFIVRRDHVPPLTALLSEFDVWDGSRPVWRVDSVEHLDRARFARLRCSEFVVV